MARMIPRYPTERAARCLTMPAIGGMDAGIRRAAP